MKTDELEKYKFPIGQFDSPAVITKEVLGRYISDIEKLPEKLRNLVSNFSEQQLNTPYRPDGWTVKQVIHHIGDSHMNALIRFKLTLTEDLPTIKPYFEDKWA